MLTQARHGIDEGVLQTAVDRLRSHAPVDRIILFGSRARGDHHEGSDVDLCVLLQDGIPAGVYTSASLWKLLRGLGVAFHPVPIRSSVFEEAKADVNALERDVEADGVVLFDARVRS